MSDHLVLTVALVYGAYATILHLNDINLSGMRKRRTGKVMNLKTDVDLSRLF